MTEPAAAPPPAVVSAAGRFVGGLLLSAEQVGGGYIHDSWRCHVAANGGEEVVLLQRLNTRVFTAPRLVMENVLRVSRHLAAHHAGSHDAERHSLTLLTTGDGKHSFVDEAGGWWRAFRFIAGSLVLERADDAAAAYQTGRIFGLFHARMAEYDGPALHVTIPHFHDTPRRLEALERAAWEDHAGRAASARDEIAAILEHAPGAALFQRLHAEGRLPKRIAHNDAKIGNILFDAGSRSALCVIDLDTVMPGFALHDFGDMIRSTAATGAEDEPDPDKAGLSVPLYHAIVRGFLDAAGHVLSDAEREHLVDAARLVTLEQAARFLTDYVSGDVYYRVDRPEQNLDRARSQLTVFRAILARQDELRALSR